MPTIRPHNSGSADDSQDAHWSYLLRLWRGRDKNWRASLQSVQTGERHMFADLESLQTFLFRMVHPERPDGSDQQERE
jgi:hypothetical protein